ncbi:MAG: c-type cytochrome [Chitinophagaceae bacterium]
MAWLQYLLNVSLSLVPFYLLYILLMQRFTFFKWNRWYIISSLLLCACIPLLRIEAPEVIYYVRPLQNLAVLPVTIDTTPVESPAQAPVASISWVTLVLGIYLSGVFFTATRLLLSIRYILLLVRQGRKMPYEGYWIIRGKHIRQNASFFHYIFLRNDLHSQETMSVVLHESIHVRQWHTADILLAEFFKIVLWFHPVVYHYKKLLQQVHEYEVDQEVAAQTDKKEYAHLLLKLQTSRPLAVVNLYSAGGTRKRIEMLFTQKSIGMKKVFYLLVIPCMLLTATYCSRKEQIATPINSAAQVTYKQYGVVEETENQVSYILLPEKIANLQDYHSFLYKGELTEVGKLFAKYGVSMSALTTPHTTGSTEMCGFILDGKNGNTDAFAKVAELLHKKQVMVCSVNKKTGKASVVVAAYDPSAAGTERVVEAGTGSFFINDESQLLLCINLTGIGTFEDKKGLEQFVNRISEAFKKEGYTDVKMDLSTKNSTVNSIYDIDEFTFGLKNPATGEQASGTFNINEMLEKHMNVICRVDKKTKKILIKPGQMPVAQVGARLFNDNCSSCHTENDLGRAPALANVEDRHTREWIYSYVRNSADMIRKGDKQAVEVHQQWNQLPMNAFPNLTNDEIDAVLEYIKAQKS